MEGVLSVEFQRLMRVFDAFPNAEVDIHVREGRPVTVYFTEPQVLNGEVIRLGGTECRFALALQGIWMALKAGTPTR